MSVVFQTWQMSMSNPSGVVWQLVGCARWRRQAVSPGQGPVLMLKLRLKGTPLMLPAKLTW
jgi:hypothetical protein